MQIVSEKIESESGTLENETKQVMRYRSTLFDLVSFQLVEVRK